MVGSVQKPSPVCLSLAEQHSGMPGDRHHRKEYSWSEKSDIHYSPSFRLGYTASLERTESSVGSRQLRRKIFSEKCLPAELAHQPRAGELPVALDGACGGVQDGGDFMLIQS